MGLGGGVKGGYTNHGYYISISVLHSNTNLWRAHVPPLVLIQVRRHDGDAPIVAVHVQDVALVVHELDFHALNVDGAEVDALVGLEGGTELDVGLARQEGIRFYRNERENVGGGGPRVEIGRASCRERVCTTV